MSHLRHYTITLAVERPDGSQCFFDLTLENPIGFSSTEPDSYLIHLANSLAESCPIILRPEEMDFSQYSRLKGLEP